MNNLGRFVLGLVCLGLSSCSRVNHYMYKEDSIGRSLGRQVGEDYVTFIEKEYFSGFLGDDNILIVRKKDGTIKKYVDASQEDLKIESIILILPNGKAREYTIENEGALIEYEQKEFDRYLKMIKK